MPKDGKGWPSWIVAVSGNPCGWNCVGCGAIKRISLPMEMGTMMMTGDEFRAEHEKCESLVKPGQEVINEKVRIAASF